MEQSNKWTWADQLSSYTFWGLCFFFLFLLIPNLLMNYSYFIIRDLGISASEHSELMILRPIANIGGIILAWILLKLKHKNLLLVYPLLTIIGLTIMLLNPSAITYIICLFLTSLCFGGVSLTLPSILSNGRGGSEMFLISFGAITFFNTVTYTSSSLIYNMFIRDTYSFSSTVLIGITASIISICFVLLVSPKLFNEAPPAREKTLLPTRRDPLTVFFLCLIPGFNIYYILYMSYRFHGEVNSFSKTNDILTPRASAWLALCLPLFAPIILYTLNSKLIDLDDESVKQKHYKSWVIALWAFFFVPISYALIQANLNNVLLKQAIATATSNQK